MDDMKEFSEGGNDSSRPQTIIIKSTKNVGLAAGLGFFLGPLGLCYSTFTGAIVMFIVNGIIGFITFGFGLFLTWPVCAIWGYIAAKRYNDALYESVR
ncbi:hypothetical protein TAMA11512_00080 [Selenomonas sp. TAMA-11512]|uniref:hypothetical protein n=1 Tax=Selenomonas sp. TAMA-11512 TaxID=3095337 RepID=UPI00308840BA|nr:hypothetical protein TAMA11512_00080 [Selenomonas sp. TAMA-11512]